MYCTNCGKKIALNANFCENCGHKLNKTNSLINKENGYQLNEELPSHNQQLEFKQSGESKEGPILNNDQEFIIEESVENSMEEDMLVYVGKNKEFYKRKWKMIKEKNNGVAWNVAALFLSTFWLGYRKMYKEVFLIALFFLCCDFLLYFIDSFYGMSSSSIDSINNGLTIGMAVFIGMYGNYFYQKHTEKNVLLIRNTVQDTQRRQLMLEQKGGPSWGGVFIALGIMLVFYILPATFIPLQSSAINSVKGGTFYDYPDVIVEDLFNTVFDNTSWDEIPSNADYDLVEFTGTKSAYDHEFLVHIQFIYDGNEFEVYRIMIDGEALDEYELFEFLDYIFFEYEND